jgi:hypothetical protein
VESAEWQKTASVIRTGKYTILYHGTAQPDPASQPTDWSGTVKGDILCSDSLNAITVAGGSLTLSPEGKMWVQGPSRTQIAEPRN